MMREQLPYLPRKSTNDKMRCFKKHLSGDAKDFSASSPSSSYGDSSVLCLFEIVFLKLYCIIVLYCIVLYLLYFIVLYCFFVLYCIVFLYCKTENQLFKHDVSKEKEKKKCKY